MYINNCQTYPIKHKHENAGDKIQKYSLPKYTECHWESLKSNSKPPPQLTASKYTSWRESKQKIEHALSWLRAELTNLKIQDQQILSQFRRCKDTIENLKAEKSVWHDSGEMSEDDLEEDEGHWEDWEISEFDQEYDRSINEYKDIAKQCLKLEINLVQQRQSPSINSSVSISSDKTSSSVSSSKTSQHYHQYSESESSSASTGSSLRQDVEVTV